MKAIKKLLVCALAAALTLGTVEAASAATKSPVTSSKRPVTKEDAKATNGARVDIRKNGTAVLSALKTTNAVSVIVPDKLVVNGVKYTVTTINAMAFAKAKKATTFTLPATIKTINAGAFFGAKKLKVLVFKGKQTIKISKDAFIGLNTKRITIKVTKKMPKKELKKLKKELKKAGFQGKMKKF